MKRSIRYKQVTFYLQNMTRPLRVKELLSAIKAQMIKPS